MNNISKIAIICGAVPPTKDAVGESALKLLKLLHSSGLEAKIFTLAVYKSTTDIAGIVEKWNLVEIIKLLRLLYRKGIEIIIFEYPNSYSRKNIFITFLPLIARLLKLKIITYLHEYSNYSFVGKARIYPILFFSNMIWTTDIRFKNEIEGTVPSAKVKFMPFCSNIEENLYSMTRKNSGEIKKNELLYFGYIRAGKGLSMILDSWREIRKIVPNIKLHIVGSLPSNPNALDLNLERQLMNNTEIVMHGFLEQDKLVDLFDKYLIILLPYEDGVSLRRSSLLTSLAFGNVVITHFRGKEFFGLEDGKNIFFFNSFDSISLCSKLEDVIKKPVSELLKIGACAQKWYFSNFSDLVMSEKIKSNLLDYSD